MFRTLSLDDRRGIVHKTEVRKKTQNPKFDKEMKFQVSADNGQAELARGSLEVAVMHKDSIGHDAIGKLSVIQFDPLSHYQFSFTALR